MLFMLILLSAAAGAAYAWWERMQPNRDMIVPDYGAAHPVFYNGEQLDGEARVREGEVLLPLDTIGPCSAKMCRSAMKRTANRSL